MRRKKRIRKNIIISSFQIDGYPIAIHQTLNMNGNLIGMGWFVFGKKQHYDFPKVLNLSYGDRNYLAGLFDGEGCVVISKHVDERNYIPHPLYSLIIDIFKYKSCYYRLGLQNN